MQEGAPEAETVDGNGPVNVNLAGSPDGSQISTAKANNAQPNALNLIKSNKVGPA